MLTWVCPPTGARAAQEAGYTTMLGRGVRGDVINGSTQHVGGPS